MAKKKELKPPKIVQPGEVYDPTAQREYFAQDLAFKMGAMSIRQRAIEHRDDPVILMECIKDYLQMCYENGKPPTHEGFLTALGITKQAASQWRLGQTHKSDPRFKAIIEYIDAFSVMNISQLLTENKVAPGTGIFLLKNYAGMKDDPDPDPVVLDEEEKTAEQIKEEYKYLVDDVDDSEAPQ